jgi:beta-lactamase class A
VLKGGIAAVAAGLLCVLAGFWAGLAFSRFGAAPPSEATTDAGASTTAPVTRTPSGGSTSAHPAFDGLQQSVVKLLSAADATGAVTVAELGGPNPQTWSYSGDQPFVAASTYKLPLLMMDAQNVATGGWKGIDSLCFQDGDYEDGWYDDYQDGTCMSRAQLDHRVGHDSDNTAAHILIRSDGGGAALNRYAMAHGAQESTFFDPNTTTSSDLARLWVNEATGRAGGRAAQQYLYPMLTHTSYEQGIPAGVPKRATVVHKIGVLDGEVNDAGLVLNGPRGDYVLAICTEGAGGDAGWKLLADISGAVWAFEATR